MWAIELIGPPLLGLAAGGGIIGVFEIEGSVLVVPPELLASLPTVAKDEELECAFFNDCRLFRR
jgi:hypothetical protein